MLSGRIWLRARGSSDGVLVLNILNHFLGRRSWLVLLDKMRQKCLRAMDWRFLHCRLLFSLLTCLSVFLSCVLSLCLWQTFKTVFRWLKLWSVPSPLRCRLKASVKWSLQLYKSHHEALQDQGTQQSKGRLVQSLRLKNTRKSETWSV